MHKTETTPFVLIHTDLKIINEDSYGGNRYSATIVDDATRWKTILLLKQKSDFIAALGRWNSQFVFNLGYKIHRIRW